MSLSITSSSNYIPPSSLVQPNQTSQVANGSDPDGDGDGGRVHKGHGGGHMQQALTQALQSLGLSVPQPTSTQPSSTSSSSTDSDGDSDGSTSGVGNVKHDMRQFMQTLFQAVKGESTAGTSSTTGTSTSQPSSFATGLSALISQVGNGSAPSNLQDAFSQLASDLQPASGSTTGATNTSTSGAGSTNVSLQALLTQLQQNVGYGASSLASTGNFLNQTA